VTREELEHAIRAACDVTGDDAVYVFGSQAILGQYPDAPITLRQSAEADICPVKRRDAIDQLDGSLGEDSRFHREFGFYVHGISIDAARLPTGWKKRVVVVSHVIGTRGKRGLCLEAHDLAASKLAAFREKDRDFVRTLLVDGLVKHRTLETRIRSLDIDVDLRERLLVWVRTTVAGMRN
jgi:hypothetical protein